MSGTETIEVERATPLDYRSLNRALRSAVKGTEAPQICHAVITEISNNRALISNPLHPDDSNKPSSEDRAKLTGKQAVSITVTYPNAAPQTTRFTRAEIEAALFLSGHLNINEIDALLLFEDSRYYALRRTDKDIIKAAIQQHQVKRRECLLFLQEILRAALVIDNSPRGKQFVEVLIRERDEMINNYGMVAKIIQRLKAAVDFLKAPSDANKKDYVPEEEMVLLTEALFLLAYTCHFVAPDALAMRTLLDTVGDIYKTLLDKEEAYLAQQKQFGNQQIAPTSEFKDYKKINLESCRNLLVLAWMATLDRARYGDRYDPKVGHRNLNELLKDVDFLRQTSNLPAMDDSFALPTTKMDKAVLAAEFVAAIFRLASAAPDEEEVASTALMVAAYGGCLTYLADDLPDWIQYGAGSMTQDADLYSDVLEDLALDTAETGLATEFVRWHHTEISRIAENLMRETFQQSNTESPGFADDKYNNRYPPSANTRPPVPDTNGGRTPGSTRFSSAYNPHTPGNPFGTSPSPSQFHPTTPFGPSTTPGGPFRPPSTPGTPFQPTTPSASLFPTTPGNATPGGSMLVATPGKPPLPPSSNNNRPPPLSGLSAETPKNNFFQMVGPTPKKREENGSGPEAQQDPNANYCIQNNLAAQLARFVARSIELAPGKLQYESTFKGARYWAGAEGPAGGFIPRMNEALYDLFEVSNQNYRMGGGVGTAFSQLLNDFLLLLTASVGKNNPIHAAHALRYLVNAGDVLISMNQLKRAIDHHISTLNAANAPKHGFAHSRMRILDDQEAQLISGMVNVVAKAAEGLKSQGGVNAFLSGLGTDLANRFSALAFFNVNAVLKASLVKGILALEDQRATVNFLEKAAHNRSKSLAIMNSYEGESGTYPVTVSILELAKSCTNWREEDYPAEAIHSIAVHFAIEKVLHEWPRRKYGTELERWRTVKTAADLLLGIGLRDAENDNRIRMLKVMAALLTPAPGTGAASTALRSLFSAAGLLRNCDGVNLNDVVGDVQSAIDYYKAWGQVLLVSTAKLGLGETYREMVDTITTCSRVMIGLFEISPGEASSRGLMAANVGDLIVVETKSIVSASSLVLNLTSTHIAAYKSGYSSSACSCVLTLLALAADMNQKIAALLVRNDTANIFPWSTFRSSVADIISEACVNNENAREAARKDMWAQPIITSSLRLVEACLGRDGGYQPGLYLLGLNLDPSGRYCTAEYGVLNALLRVMLDPDEFIVDMDNPSRATAAVFVQRLSANTVRKTSYAVLEHIKEYGDTHVQCRGSGLADEMLFRILDKAPSMGVISSQSENSVNWKALAELITACLSLSALHVRLFPESGNSNNTVFGIENGDMDQLSTAINGAPSPFELYKLILQISRGTPRDSLFQLFKAWYNLFGIRALIYSKNRSFAAGPVFIELAKSLLAALSSSEANTETSFVRKDGGYTAASAVVSCVQYICEWEKLGVAMDEVQVSNLLLHIVQAASGLAGSNVDSSRARTMLYSAFLKVAELARKYVSEEGIARAFGGRVGPRQVSGAEGFLTVCCEDAVNSSSPATKAVSMTAACQVTLMDPTRAIPALNSQSRLRKIVQVGIADSEVRSLIAKSCNRTTLELNSGDPHMAKERAARIVCYAAMALIHAVSTVPNGSRAIVDSGCMECLALILNALETSRMSSFDMDGQQMNGVNGEDTVVDADMGGFGSGERRAEMTGQIASTAAAAISFPDSSLVEGAFEVLEKGRGCFSDALRMLRSGRPAYLDAISSMASILSRIPAELFVETKGAYQLRYSLAGSLKVFVEVSSGNADMQQNNMEMQVSNLGIGFLARKPMNMKELNCAKKRHPIGGTIFDRQVMQERIMCLHSIMAALRSGTNSLLFKPGFGRNDDSSTATNMMADEIGTGNHGFEQYNETEPVGSLVDVVRVAKAALSDIRRLAEESALAKSMADGDTTSLSLSTNKRKEIGDLCIAKYGVDIVSLERDEDNQNYTVAKYMRREADDLRTLANFCIAIFEDCLSILRDYVHLAKSAVLGEGVGVYRGGRNVNTSHEKRPLSVSIGAATGHKLIEDSKEYLLPLCKQVDNITSTTWGPKDSSYCKQLSRQIRSYILR